MNWLGSREITVFQDALIRQHGGLRSAPRRGALEATLSRPRALYETHPGTSIVELGSVYAWEFARNQVFADANQRLGLVACAVFLSVNGHSLDASEEEAAFMLGNLISGRTTEADLSEWVDGNTVVNDVQPDN